LTGIVASVDGQKVVKDTITGEASNAENLGIELAERLRQQGAQEILDAIFAEIQRG
jgi:hydroxymethylbilane synthase